MENKSIYDFKLFSYIRILIYIIIPLYIILQPVNFMDDTSLCIFYNLLHKKCLFCGMTRAFVHIFHLDFKGAYMFNSFSLIVFIVVCLLVLFDLYMIINKNPLL
jgi:hypothetical protein